jgi:hypothetical protein
VKAGDKDKIVAVVKMGTEGKGGKEKRTGEGRCSGGNAREVEGNAEGAGHEITLTK